MDAAVADLESEIRALEAEEQALLASVQRTVGELSDLRYGRLANPQLPGEVLEGLRHLQESCEGKT